MTGDKLIYTDEASEYISLGVPLFHFILGYNHKTKDNVENRSDITHVKAQRLDTYVYFKKYKLEQLDFITSSMKICRHSLLYSTSISTVPKLCTDIWTYGHGV